MDGNTKGHRTPSQKAYPVNEQARARAPPRVLYNGTCYEYLGLCGAHYRTRIPYPFYLTNSPTSAIGFAVERARNYDSIPIVLVVDTKKLRLPPTFDGTQWIAELGIDTFEYVPGAFVRTDRGWRNWKENIAYWTRAIPSLPKEQLVRDNEDAFKRKA